MSAPTSRPSTPKWFCPCGRDSNPPDYEGMGGELPDRELLDIIILQAKISLSEAHIIKEDYVYSNFGVDYHKHHDSWKENHYDWLPNRQEMPKQIGQNLEEEHLQQQVMELALKNSYQFLQKVAVGLEQVVQDQETYGGEFLGRFKEIESKLNMMLCEIHMAMTEKRIEQLPNVPREIMTSNFREFQNATERKLRDWLILREYLNVLEYILQVFEYIKERIPS